MFELLLNLGVGVFVAAVVAPVSFFVLGVVFGFTTPVFLLSGIIAYLACVQTMKHL